VHRAILIVDVEKFGDHARTNAHQLAVRHAMYKALRRSFAKARISWADCTTEDRGDGVLVLVPADVPKSWLVTKVVTRLADVLVHHNAACSPQTRIRLRVALHAGEVHYDARGVTGAAINFAFRLISAEQPKYLLRASSGALVLVVSNWFYDEVVRHDAAAMPTSFHQIYVTAKETVATAWARVFESSVTRIDRDAEETGRTASDQGSDVPGLPYIEPASPRREMIQMGTHNRSPVIPASAVYLYRIRDQISTVRNRRIGIITGTIRRVRCADVWVNSENTDMKMSRTEEYSISGIIRYEGALRDSAGHIIDDVIADELAREVAGKCPVAAGAAITTGPGELAHSHSVRYVIHVAAVQGEPGAGYRQVRDVGCCVTNALAEADRLSDRGQPVTTILFPLLGTGQGGGDLAETIQALSGAAADYLAGVPETRITTVFLLTTTYTELAVCQETFRENPRFAPVSS